MAVLVPNSRYPAAVRAVAWNQRSAPPSILSCIVDWLTSWNLRRGLIWTAFGAYLYASVWFPRPWLVLGSVIRYTAYMVVSMSGQLGPAHGAKAGALTGLSIVNYAIFGELVPLMCVRRGWRYLWGPDLMLLERTMHHSLVRQRRKGRIIEIHDEVVAGLISAATDLPLDIRETGGGIGAPTAVQLLGLYFTFVAGSSLHLQRRLKSGLQLSGDTIACVIDSLRRVGAMVVAMEFDVLAYAGEMARLDQQALEAGVRAEAALVPSPD